MFFLPDYYSHNQYPNKRTLNQILMVLLFFIAGCAAPTIQTVPSEKRYSATPHESTSKKWLIFFDGTANDILSRTNVRRLFEMVSVEENPNVWSIYMDGVGSSSAPITGSAFGYGMKERILDGYKILAKNRSAGEKIYIFGFSRGAHQARALAGLMAYCGLPDASKMEKAVLDSLAEKIWNTCRKEDEAEDNKWITWKPEDGPFLAKKLGLDTKVAEVEFLGIWDTVPGSQFKKFHDYGESEDERDGIRYKVQPYPTIHVIAHALSRDEKRSKFRPVFVRAPIDPTRTKLHQVWFPGAHSDVGGGYDDSNDLAGISLNWMVNLLKDQNIFHGIPPKAYSDSKGLAHWSLGAAPGNIASGYEDRKIGLDTLVATIDQSVSEREEASKKNGGVPIRSCLKKQEKEVVFKPYPIPVGTCVQKDD